MAPLQCAVLFLVLASAVSSQPLTTNLAQLEKLNSALSQWKRLSAGKPGYVVRHQLFMNYVDLASGKVKKNVCLSPTQPPTRTPSTSVRMLHRVEEMFAVLEKALHDNFCKLVRVGFSKSNAYPVIAKLSGCKDPAMDAVIELGEVLLAPKKYLSKMSLCAFAEKNSNLLDSDSDAKVDFVRSLQGLSAVLPKKQLHAEIFPAVFKAKTALSKAEKAVQENVRAAAKVNVPASFKAPFKHQTKKLYSAIAKSRDLVKKLHTGMPHHGVPEFTGKVKQAINSKIPSKHVLAGLRHLSPSVAKKDLLKVQSEVAKKLEIPHHPRTNKPVVAHKPAKHEDAVQLLDTLDEGYLPNEKGYGSPDHRQPARNGLRTSIDVYEKVRGHSIEDNIVYLSGRKLEKIVDGNRVYIIFAGKVIHDGVLPPNGDKLSTVEKAGQLVIIYNQVVIYEGNVDHGHYEYFQHVRKILFFTGCALLAIAMVMIVGKSLFQACKKKKPVQVKGDGSVAYSALDESSVALDEAPAYSDNRAHVVCSPDVVTV